MELSDVLRRRRMVRSFDTRPVPAPTLDRILSDALRGPSAGFAQGFDLIVLEGPSQTARFWDISLPAERREGFPWPGLLAAPVLIVPLADPGAYVARYSDADKAHSGLGEGPEAWPTPYWIVDTAFASMIALLATVDEGLGACFFGIFRNEAELLVELGVPEGHRPIGAIALGYPASTVRSEKAASGDRASRSVARGRRPFDEAVHRGGW